MTIISAYSLNNYSHRTPDMTARISSIQILIGSSNIYTTASDMTRTFFILQLSLLMQRSSTANKCDIAYPNIPRALAHNTARERQVMAV